MKVVVTGASGYIGRHVVDALIKMHHEVIAVDMINNLQIGLEETRVI